MKKTALLNRPCGAPSSLSQHNLDIADAPTPLRGGSLELGPEEDVYDARRVRDHHIDGHGKLILGRVVAWMGTQAVGYLGPAPERRRILAAACTKARLSSQAQRAALGKWLEGAA